MDALDVPIEIREAGFSGALPSCLAATPGPQENEENEEEKCAEHAAEYAAHDPTDLCWWATVCLPKRRRQRALGRATTNPDAATAVGM